MRAGLATLTVTHWDGELPRLGEFVKSTKGRTAFKIVEIKRAIDPAGYVAKFVCERQRAETLGAQDIVHPWQWNKR